MIIALCGSLSLGENFLKVKEELESLGHEVLIPESIRKFNLKTEEDVSKFKSEDGDYKNVKPEYMREHFEKIGKSDAILVVNKEKNGIKNYVGGNTFAEIMVAFFLKKKIFLLNPIPEDERTSIYREEIIGANPVILDGDIRKIA